MSKEVVAYAKNINPEILVEAEYGFIGKSSKLLDKLPENVLISEDTLTKAEDAIKFIEETKIDLFAPAVGNIHGMVKGGNPQLNIERIKSIKDAVKIPLVLHGGSGLKDEEFVQAIDAGISIIHINTEIRIAYKNGLLNYLEQNKEEIAPYKYLKAGKEEMQKVIENRLELFNKI
jgi:fructose-bisphosphate aldolase class II